MRKFAITDIHGACKTFKQLLKDIQFSTEDELYLLGDYIDRGPDSKGVIDHIWHLQDKGYSVFCLRGNHEQMLLDELAKPNYYYNGEPNVLASFGVENNALIPKEYKNWLSSLEYYFEVDEYILVHAGLNFDMPNPLEAHHSMIWIRQWEEDIDKNWMDGRIIIHGHTPAKKNVIEDRLLLLEQLSSMSIDNGCVFPYAGLGRLCAFELGNRALFFRDFMD